VKLTEDQKKQVAQWVAEGASLSDVQRRLKEECAVSIT
jgi:ribosomal protein S16